MTEGAGLDDAGPVGEAGNVEAAVPAGALSRAHGSIVASLEAVGVGSSVVGEEEEEGVLLESETHDVSHDLAGGPAHLVQSVAEVAACGGSPEARGSVHDVVGLRRVEGVEPLSVAVLGDEVLDLVEV